MKMLTNGKDNIYLLQGQKHTTTECGAPLSMCLARIAVQRTGKTSHPHELPVRRVDRGWLLRDVAV